MEKKTLNLESSLIITLIMCSVFFYVFPLTFLLWDECWKKVVSYEMIVNKLNLFKTYDDHLYNVTIINA